MHVLLTRSTAVVRRVPPTRPRRQLLLSRAAAATERVHAGTGAGGEAPTGMPLPPQFQKVVNVVVAVAGTIKNR
jgi:hypothetical protein